MIKKVNTEVFAMLLKSLFSKYWYSSIKYQFGPLF